MASPYRIVLEIDDARAVAAYKRGVAGMADVEKAALRAANAIESALNRAGASAERAAGRASSAWAAASEGAAGFAKGAAAAERASDRMGDSFARAAARASAAGTAMTAPVLQLQRAASRAFPAMTGQVRQLQLASAAAGEALQLVGRYGGAEILKAVPAVQRVRAEFAGVEEQLGRVDAGTKKAGASMAGFWATAAAVQAGGSVLGAVLAESEALEAYWQKLAAEASSFRDSLRELASLKGEGGPNNRVAGGVLRLALDAGMTSDKSARFDAAYENLGPSVREKGHYKPDQGTPEALEKAVVAEGARTGRRLGVDETAAAEAVGTAGLFHTFRTKEDAMEQVGGALKGLSEGKVPYTKGVVALNKGAAKLLDPAEAAAEGAKAGRLGSYAEAGVYMGALSLGTGTADQAQHRMVQNSRVLNPDAGNREGLAALQKAGITEGMTDPQKLIQLSKYLKTEKVTSARDWLSKNNLGTTATREGMEASLKIADVLESRLAKQRESAKTNATGKATVEANAGFMATDRSASAANVASVRDAMDKLEGVAGPEEFEKAKQAAEERMRQRDPDYYSVPRRVLTWMSSVPSLMTSGVLGHGGMLEDHAQLGALAELRKQGKAVGVDVDKQFPDVASGTYRTRAAAFTKASEAVKAAGGDPMGLKALTDEARKRVGAMEDAAPARAPDALGKGAMNAPGVLAFDAPVMKVGNNRRGPALPWDDPGLITQGVGALAAVNATRAGRETSLGGWDTGGAGGGADAGEVVRLLGQILAELKSAREAKQPRVAGARDITGSPPPLPGAPAAFAIRP